MSSEEAVHRAFKAWLQAAEDAQPWLRRAKWAVQTRRSDDEPGPWRAGDDPDAAPPEAYNVWIEITPRGDTGLADERGGLAGALDGTVIEDLTVRDVREVGSTAERLAIRLRLRA